MSERPADAPASCPGTGSEGAGAAEGCAGCPNRAACASGAPPDASAERLLARLAAVKHKILVLSGKGGVGKSTVSALLAQLLGQTRQVALLDVDICGPSQPTILGALGEQVHQSLSGWSPVFVDENLSLMSVGFLLSSGDEAVVWRGPKKNGLIRQFLGDVNWGAVDFMIIDAPPGTSDEHLSVVQLLSDRRLALDGAVLVSTPQELALQDVRKEAAFCRRLGVPVLGLVENMSAFECPRCERQAPLFPAADGAPGGGGRRFCAQTGLRFLGALPVDPHLARCCDEGLNFWQAYPDAPAAHAFRQVAANILEACENQPRLE